MSKRMRARMWAIVCLVGFLICLALAGGIAIAQRDAQRRVSTTFYTPLDGEARWEGDWDISEQGADPSQAGSLSGVDRVTIPFTGTQLALRVRRGDYRAYFWITVDGEPANRLPRRVWKPALQQRSTDAYLVLSSPDYASQITTIPVVAGLRDGAHVATIVADRGWDQYPLVGWQVSRGPDLSSYRQALKAATALATICLTGAVWGMAREQGSKGAREQRSGGAGGLTFYVLRLTSYASRLTPYVSRFTPYISLLIAAGVFYVSPWLPLTLVGLLALALLVLLRLDLGLALVALTAPFYLHPRSIFGKSFSMAEIALLLCLASWGLRWALARLAGMETRPTGWSITEPAQGRARATSRPGDRPHNRTSGTPCPSKVTFNALDVAVLFFVLVAVASTLFAHYRHIALRELRVTIVEPAIFYLMVRSTDLDKKAMRRIVGAFALGGVSVALIGLAQYALDINIITAEQGFRRLRSVYGSPNNAALYLGRVLPVLVAIALFARIRWRRLLYGLGAVAVGLAVLLSFSRGAILLGVPLSLLAMGVLAGGRWRWASLGVVALVAIGLLPLLRTPRFAGMLDPSSGTLFFRLQLWRASWKMVRDHVWLGVGPDNFLYQYRGRYILPGAWQEPHLSHAHNVVLSYATRLGLLGLAAGGWLQVSFWRLALPQCQRRDAGHRALALGLAGSMVSFLAHGLVDASYFFPDLAYAFLLTLSLVQCVKRNGPLGVSRGAQSGRQSTLPDVG